MSTPRWRGVRFLVPGFDVPAQLPGMPPSEPAPGLMLSARGGLQMVSDRAAVRQAVLILLLTRPGERVMRPTYGCQLYRLVFWPNDDTTAGLAIHYVRQAVERWEPRIDRLRVDASRDPGDPGRLYVTLEYRVRATGEEDRLAVRLDLEGGAG